jgi:hypothetical protein
MEVRKCKAVAFLFSAVLTIIIIGSMIIIHELDSPFKVFLNSLTGHHWVTKSVFAAVLFPLFSAIFYLVLGSEKARKAMRADNIWAWSLLLVAVTIIFFLASIIYYVIHYFTL